MYKDISNVWKLTDFMKVGFALEENKKLITLLLHYFGEEWVYKRYTKGVNIGLDDDHCRHHFYIEVGNWYRGNWYRNRNGKHIAFYFWNHGGSSAFEKEGGKIIKNFIRPEDRKRRHDDRFVVFLRDAKNLEEGVLYENGVELGSRTTYLVPIVRKSELKVGGDIKFLIKDRPYPEVIEELQTLLKEKGLDPISDYREWKSVQMVISFKEYQSMVDGLDNESFYAKMFHPITRTETRSDGTVIVHI